MIQYWIYGPHVQQSTTLAALESSKFLSHPSWIPPSLFRFLCLPLTQPPWADVFMSSGLEVTMSQHFLPYLLLSNSLLFLLSSSISGPIQHPMQGSVSSCDSLHKKRRETKFLGVNTELGGYCHLLMEQMSYSEAPNDLSKFGVVHNQQA